MCTTHVGLKENTWSFRVGLEVVSTDYLVLVYKVVNLVQSSLLSSLVLTQYKVYSLVQL